MAKKKTKKSAKYWRKKADSLITQITVGQPCEACKAEGRTNTYNTCGHHVVAKSLSGYYRHRLENLIVLCPSHHTMGNEMAPHSKYQPAVVAFMVWLEEDYPEKYKLLLTYKGKQGKIDYEARFVALQEYIKEKRNDY